VKITHYGDGSARKMNIPLIQRSSNSPIGQPLGRRSIAGFMSAEITSTRRMNRGMEEVPIPGPMAASTMENGRTTRNTVEDTRCGPMVPHSRENGRTPSSMDEEDIRGQAAVPTRECG